MAWAEWRLGGSRGRTNPDRRWRSGRGVSGIGVTAIESRLGVRQVIDQVKLARQAGAAGVAFFALDYTLVNDILPYLRLGLFK